MSRVDAALPIAGADTACPPANTADPLLGGALVVDKTITLGGSPGVSYTISLHIQGVVESKLYTGGTDADGTALSPAANGFRTGGTTTGEGRNVFMIRVTNPGAAANTDYFLNSLQPPATGENFVLGVDYVAAIEAEGGARIRLVAAAPDCHQTKNCDRLSDSGTCTTPVVIHGIEATALSRNPTFNFSNPYNGEWLVMSVRSVTSR